MKKVKNIQVPFTLDYLITVIITAPFHHKKYLHHALISQHHAHARRSRARKFFDIFRKKIGNFENLSCDHPKRKRDQMVEMDSIY